MPSARLLCVESHATLAGVLRKTLQAEAGVVVVGEARSAETVPAMLTLLQPDAVIVDVNLEDRCGLETVSLILEQVPGMRVILLIDQDDVRYHQAASQRGACTCVCKAQIATDLAPALQRVLTCPTCG